MGKGKPSPDEVREAAAQEWGVPSTCDVFERKVEETARQLASGVDPTVAKIRIFVAERGQQHRIMGEWPPSEVSSAWIIETFGLGTYIVKGYNAASDKVCEGKVSFWDPATRGPLGAPAASEGGAKDPSTRIKSAMADMAESMALQALAARASDTGAGRAPPTDWGSVAAGVASVIGAMVPLMQGNKNDAATQALVELAKRKDNPRGGADGGPGFQDMIAILTFGMTLAEKKGKVTPEDKEHPVWKMIPSIVDTVGVPFATTLATAILGAEKAAPVIDAINQHSQARIEEARADQTTVDDPGVVDTTGATVQ